METSTKDMDTEDKESSVSYHYSADINSANIISQLEEENKILKETVSNLRTEVSKFQKSPLLVGEVKEVIGNNLIVKLTNGNEFFVDVSSEAKNLKPGDHVLLEQKNLTVIRKIGLSSRFNVEKFVIMERPEISWDEIGGLNEQANELREMIELPLKKPELFEKIGITPPKGVLLYGLPGTGKTLLGKAVASSTKSTFIELVGSELVQKFIGEGSKLIKEIFQLAREKAPSIVFIDELDAIAATRVELGTSGEREVQRTFMQLLAEIDGFKHLGNVKIIGCTNRKDILDPAIMRPGRLDRLIYVPVPDAEGLKDIFKIHTKNMNLAKIDSEEIIKLCEGFTGAEIKAMCTEAGYFAIRGNRTKVTRDDFLKAIEKVKEEEDLEYLSMFG